MNASDLLTKSKVIVLKIGTALIVEGCGSQVRQGWIDILAQDIKALKNQGKKVVIVSSGAVAMGRNLLGIPLDMPPSQISLEKKQASSAAGQFYVFNGFHKAFEQQQIKHAQVLLTMSETENRKMYLNARATLEELLKADIVPVINENDVISTEEIRFGDNDRLASRVAQMINADCVLLLSTTDGLYTVNPDKDQNAEHIPVIEGITEEHFKMAGEAVPGMSTGGMKSKLDAALSSNQAGIPLIIADGKENGCLNTIIDDKYTRTSVFLASYGKKSAKKRWIGSHMQPKGVIKIDKGASDALKSGKSLLPVGVVEVIGDFERGDIVKIFNPDDQHIATGITAFSAEDAESIIGQDKSLVHTLQGYIGRDEFIHRNDLVLIDSAA